MLAHRQYQLHYQLHYQQQQLQEPLQQEKKNLNFLYS